MTVRANPTPRRAFGRQRRGFMLCTLALILAAVLAASYGVLQIMERRAHSSAEKLVSETVEHIDNKMNEIRIVTESASKTARRLLDEPDTLERLVHFFVADNSFVLGSTVAFEPDAFPEKGRCFAPYSWIDPDGTLHDRQLGTETDYYQEEWYAETKRSGAEYWCEPYFDEGGAKIMMCTFSVPLFDADGGFRAVMTADVGLKDLTEYISSIAPFPDSFIVLRSGKGTFLTDTEPDAGTGSDTIIIKGMTEIGWSVELVIPFTYLMRGDTGVFFYIGVIFLMTLLFVFAVNHLMTGLQKRSSAEYQNVIDAISRPFTSIFLLSLETGDTFVFRSPERYAQFSDLIGSEKTAFTEKMTQLLKYDCSPQDLERMRTEITPERIRARLTSQDRYEVRFRKELADGSRWYEMRVFVMERDVAGAPVRAVIAFVDMNESVLKEKEAQDTLEKALEMAESANRAKTSFLFNMSHDIRTPMNAIIGFTNMALKHLDDRERVADSLGKMQEAGELLLSLINDILDMSRIESGKIRPDESEGDVFLSFSNIDSTMQEMAKAKNISLEFSFGDIPDRYVYADFSRCTRVFVNIITNAIKYTKPGGHVHVRCEQLGRRDGFGIYRYSFEDNGIGMSEDFQKRVFDEFAREETATVSGIQGTGLGLSVCRSFVTAMNGTIECRSVQGEGSTFTVTLPFRLQEGTSYTNPLTGMVIDASDSDTAGKRIDFSGRRVLLVEDNELNREIAEDILSEEGILVDSAADGSAAVRMLRETGPERWDFVLMDIQMPIMDGYEATRLIREMYPRSGLPIIALSANAFEEDRVKSISAGMNDHVAKPINPELLKITVAKYLR